MVSVILYEYICFLPAFWWEEDLLQSYCVRKDQ